MIRLGESPRADGRSSFRRLSLPRSDRRAPPSSQRGVPAAHRTVGCAKAKGSYFQLHHHFCSQAPFHVAPCHATSGRLRAKNGFGCGPVHIPVARAHVPFLIPPERELLHFASARQLKPRRYAKTVLRAAQKTAAPRGCCCGVAVLDWHAIFAGRSRRRTPQTGVYFTQPPRRNPAARGCWFLGAA